MKRIFALLLTTFLMIISCFSVSCAKENSITQMSDWEFTISQLSGKDAQGRQVKPFSEYAEKKYVGVYFFPWFGGHDNKIYDISQIMKKYENGIVGNPENPLWSVGGAGYDPKVSPNGAFHYWNEPLFGYYHSADPWVITRQMEMLGWAQVDFIMMDYTNANIYEDTTKQILSIIKELNQKGCPVPKMAFMLPNNEKSPDTLERVWDAYLSKEEYAECFFIADEEMNPSRKPLVTADFSSVTNQEILSGIWAKQMFWAGSPKNPEYFPAGDANINQTNFNGMMGVNVGINTSWFSDGYLYPEQSTVFGRGWNREDMWGVGDEKEEVLKGTLFEEQWKKAFEEKVDLVFISCWNEFAAQKQSTLKTDYHSSLRAVFVDTFSEAFSKDIEPVKGDLGDNYYMQLVEKVREFKSGENAVWEAVDTSPKTIDIQDIKAWDAVEHSYFDFDGDTIERCFQSIDPSIIYEDYTNRNDIVRLKFANDSENLYFMIETEKDITEYEAEDETWMNLYLSTGTNASQSDFNVRINRTPVNGVTSVDCLKNNQWVTEGTAKYFVSGNRICFSVSMNLIGVEKGMEIGIKATDNVSGEDIYQFYLGGDSAPMGRLNYTYSIA